MKTTYEQIVNVANIGKKAPQDLNAIFALAEQDRLPPSAFDAPRRLVLAIDVQNDFIEGGSLAVPGSVGDVERMTRFIYNNMGGISRIMCSLDTHVPQQIFHPCWWADNEGNHPAPYTVITLDDVRADRWHPVIVVKDREESNKYLEELEGQRKKNLCIWPYHCIQGTAGAMLENEFANMVYFHSVARASKPVMIPKGNVPYSEMYGIIKPEYTKDNFINTPVLTAIETFDQIYVMGEAASHCFLVSVKQIAEYFANRPEVTQKITILEDCTSPIPGFEDSTKDAFAQFENKYGIKFAKSTDIHL